MKRRAAFIVLFVGTAAVASADIRVDRKTGMKMPGPEGEIVSRLMADAGAGLSSTIIKGDRRMILNGNISAQLIDLTEEKIYQIDLRRRRYTVMTFEQMRQQHRAALAMTEELRRKNDDKDTAVEDAVRLAKTIEQAKHMRFERTRKQTGRQRIVNGFEAIEVVSTMSMATAADGERTMTIVEWLVPEIENYNEIEEFEKRYAAMIGAAAWQAEMAKMPVASASSPLAQTLTPNIKDEDDGTTGIAVLTVTVVGETAGVTAEQQKEPTEKKASGSGFGGLAGRLGRSVLGSPGRSPQNADTMPPITSQMEIVKVSSVVSDAEVSLPQGFKDETRR